MELIPLIHLFIRAFAGVFVILDPFGASSHFLALTSQHPSSTKKAIAKKACIVAFGVLIFFSLAGGALFQYFGLTLAALKIAGGILLFTIALGMLYGKRTGAKTTPEEEKEHSELEDITVIPMAIPILSGPGAITTVMVLAGEAQTPMKLIMVLLAILVSVIICYLVLANSVVILNLLKMTGIKILTRIMGLIMSVIAVQFVINGVADVLPLLVKKLS
ncbi:MAG: NAAT family transporter [Deltaproteobacteria bacterium]|nr:NAAT family transporter [Deltaproteobacteria bacterium]